jgi:hypothetical protein
VISGHFAKKAVGLASEQSPEPPAQFLNPEAPIRSTPIKSTVGPVTIGGKTFWSTLGGRNDRAISTREHKAAVPTNAPYALGHGPKLPLSSTGQYPLAYICAKAPDATGMMAKEVPTTEIRPVPMWYLGYI